MLYISRKSKSLCSSLNTYITFQSFQTMLLLKTSEVSFFTNSICVCAMLRICWYVLNFSTSNVQTNCFTNILQSLPSFGLIFLILVIWQFNTFCITGFLSVIFAVVVILVFISFLALMFNVYVKLTCIIGIFVNFLIHIFIIFLRIIFKIFYFLTFGVFYINFACFCYYFKCFLFVFY